MKAAVGDRYFVASGRPGHERMGHVVELRHPDGTPPYVVRWHDTGAEEVVFPRHDGRVEPQGEPVRPEAAAPRVRLWRMDIEVVEDGPDTTARVVLHEGPVSTVVTGGGHATRSPQDENVPEIGDELAVARALDQVSSTLKQAAGRSLAAMADPAVALVDVRPRFAVDLRQG
ncbi:MAG: dsRBD fold-containing protein [Candidatus Nanopelagicales bacterium]